MEILFNKYYRILVDSLILFIFFSVSSHPLLVKEVGYFALLIQYLAKFLLICYCLKLSYIFLKDYKFSLLCFLMSFIFMIILVISCFGIIIHDIENYPSIFVMIILFLVFSLFYLLYYDRNKVFIKLSLIKKNNSRIRKVFFYLALLFLSFLFLESIIKFIPQFRILYSQLLEIDAITFSFRLCGIERHPNGWALILFYVMFIYSIVRKKFNFKNNFFLVLVLLTFILTLSKTAFFILLFLIIINFWRILLKIKFRHIVITTISITLVVVLLERSSVFENGNLKNQATYVLTSMLDPNNSYTVNERKKTYIDAIESIRQYPLFGKGYLNFTAYSKNSGDLTVHNTPLALMAYFGIVFGSFIYFYIFLFPFVLLFFKYGLNMDILNLFIVTLVFTNTISLAHDIIPIFVLYIAFIVFEITSRIKIKSI